LSTTPGGRDIFRTHQIQLYAAGGMTRGTQLRHCGVEAVATPRCQSDGRACICEHLRQMQAYTAGCTRDKSRSPFQIEDLCDAHLSSLALRALLSIMERF